jgi:hypothetical protein
MNRSQFWVPAVVVIACSTTWLVRDALVAAENPVSPVTSRWEYKMMSGDQLAEFGDSEIAEKGINPLPGELYRRAQETGLDKLGIERWELVAVQTTGSTNFWYFFKRPKLAK